LSGEEASAPELVALPLKRGDGSGTEYPYNLLSTSFDIRDEKASVCRKAFGSWSLDGIYLLVAWEIYILPFRSCWTHGSSRLLILALNIRC
jgi:hypothetical protein